MKLKSENGVVLVRYKSGNDNCITKIPLSVAEDIVAKSGEKEKDGFVTVGDLNFPVEKAQKQKEKEPDTDKEE